MRQIPYPIQLLIFPEGTDLSPDNLKKSHEFSSKQNIQKLDYVMWPRIKGTYTCIYELKPILDSIYDVTIAYPDYLPINEVDVFKGLHPKEVHFLIERFPIKNVPMDDEESFGVWCKNRWLAKEETLKKFYNGDKTFNFTNQPRVEFSGMDPNNFKCLVFWAVLNAIIIYLYLNYLWPWIWSLIAIAIFVVVSHKGGIERFEADYINQRIESSQSKNQ